MMKLFNIQNKNEANKKNTERPIKVIKTSENSWQIVYSDLPD